MAGEGVSQESNGKKCSKQKKEEVQRPRGGNIHYLLQFSGVPTGYLVAGHHGVLPEDVMYSLPSRGSTHANECQLPVATWTCRALIQGLTARCSHKVQPSSLPSSSRLRKPFLEGTASPACSFTQSILTLCLSRLRCFQALQGHPQPWGSPDLKIIAYRGAWVAQ